MNIQAARLRLKTRSFTFLVVLSSLCGNFSLSWGMRQVGSLVSFSPLAYMRAVFNPWVALGISRSEEHTSELQSLRHLVCRLLLEKHRNPSLRGTKRNPAVPGSPRLAVRAGILRNNDLSFFLISRPPQKFALFPNPTPSR